MGATPAANCTAYAAALNIYTLPTIHKAWEITEIYTMRHGVWKQRWQLPAQYLTFSIKHDFCTESKETDTASAVSNSQSNDTKQPQRQS